MISPLMEQLISGIIQGIAEWLPVSSEGMLVLVKTLIFHSQAPVDDMIKDALFLHLGSVMAALIYFRKDIFLLLKAFPHIRCAEHPQRPLLFFLFWATLISGGLGLILLKSFSGFISQYPASGRLISLLVGLCLLMTGILQLIKKSDGLKTAAQLRATDSVVLGIAQGFAALPGLSRSGLTVAALLFRQFRADQAIRISFLMSIPIVIAGNLVLNASPAGFKIEQLAGLGTSFLFSLLTIDLLLKAARKINFGLFVLGMGVLIIASALLF